MAFQLQPWRRKHRFRTRFAALAAVVVALIAATSACGGLAGTASPGAARRAPMGSMLMHDNRMQDPRSRYLYVWAGTDGRTKPDRLLTFNFDPGSPQYGKLVADTIIPGPGGAGNEPHHCGLSANGLVLACGGLLSSLRNQNTLFFFSLKNPAHPVLFSSQRTPLAAFPDAFIPLPDNGFLVSEMGSLDGGAPGRVAEFSGADKLVGMYPANPPQAFNPHGMDIRPDANLMVTCDYVEPASTLNATPGPVLYRSTVRIWNFRHRAVVKTITLPSGAVSMDCLLVPKNKQDLGYVGGTGNGELYLFNPNAGTAEPVFDFDSLTPDAQTQVMAVSADGSRLFVPYQSPTGQGGVAMLDISHPSHPRLLFNLNLGEGSGPHMAMLAGNGTQLVVTDYFLNEDNFGKLHFDGDHFVRVIDIGADRLRLDPRFQVNMNTLIPGVRLRPHGTAAIGMTMGTAG